MIPIEGETCVEVWAKAIIKLSKQPNNEANNVILQINNPNTFSDHCNQFCTEYDALLQNKDKQPLHTVSQTIFPDGLYRREGTKGVYETYPEKIYPKIKYKKWGTYAFRLVRWASSEGSFNQLENIVDKIKKVRSAGKNYSDCYEVSTFSPLLDASLFDPKSDRKVRYGRQCLSHLSFKVDFKSSPEELRLTAIYRNHFYFERLLGNMLGLTKLMGFVAKETGINKEVFEPIGPLVIHSTHAKIETAKTDVLKLAREYLSKVS